MSTAETSFDRGAISVPLRQFVGRFYTRGNHQNRDDARRYTAVVRRMDVIAYITSPGR